MQVNTYISPKDYETLQKHLPGDCETTPQFMAKILREKAQDLRDIICEECPKIQKPEVTRG